MRRPDVATPLLILVLTTSAHAECMRRSGSDVRDVRSPNGQLEVRVVSRGLANSAAAKAEWYRLGGGAPQQFRILALLNPIAPNDFIVTNDGTLVTFDDRCSLGRENAVVIYSPSGDVVKKYSLKDLYSHEDIRRFDEEWDEEGTIWRCYSASSLVLSPSRELSVGDDLTVTDAVGGRFVFTLATGSFKYERGATHCSDP